MLGVLSSNLIILVAATVIVVVFARRTRGAQKPKRRDDAHRGAIARFSVMGEVVRGFLGAGAILAGLLFLRRLGVVGSTIGTTQLAWLSVVVVTEELVKYALTGPLRRERRPRGSANPNTAPPTNRPTADHTPPRLHSRALLRGWGFALAENLMYILVLPGRFLLRLVLAGTVHLVTVTVYAWPQSVHRTRATAGLVRLGIGIVVHLGYNVLVVSTESSLLIW